MKTIKETILEKLTINKDSKISSEHTFQKPHKTVFKIMYNALVILDNNPWISEYYVKPLVDQLLKSMKTKKIDPTELENSKEIETLGTTALMRTGKIIGKENEELFHKYVTALILGNIINEDDDNVTQEIEEYIANWDFNNEKYRIDY